ncbi:MAG: NAD(+) kinase [Rhodocyclaceae bacterium]|nr:NAD(+) kinase [Rhodocyclaceae bacterium]MBX3667787.1 NAD(+) kinase [Rhodocyclaceae bacterium]
MDKRISKVALIGKFRSGETAEAVRLIADYLERRGLAVFIEQDTGVSLGEHGWRVLPLDEIGKASDLAVVLGGDGTMLAAARALAPSGVALVGVNRGRLGFLTDIASAGMLDSLGRLLDGEYRIEHRFLLHTEVRRQGDLLVKTDAVNDVVLAKGGLGRMIEFSVRVDGEFIYSQRSDGIIVATPTGSTAYALSANGPILHPSVRGFAMVPLCPHALSNRPIVLGHEAEVEITLAPPYEAVVHVDGQLHLDVHGEDHIRIRRSDHEVTLLHLPDYSYFGMLREKLHWSELPKEH